MSVLLGLLTAICFGAGDFCGGISTKRVSAFVVVALSHLVGLAGVLMIAPLIAERFTLQDFLIGALGGGFGGVGVVLLYRGLARGPMVVVAPLTAITSAAVPTLWGVATGESFSGRAWAGIAVALVAIVLISIPSDTNDDDQPVTVRVVIESLAAGLFFGLLFVLLDSTEDATAPWPVVGARTLTATLLLATLLLRRRDELRAALPSLPLLALTGIFDTGSNVLFIIATTIGDLTIVAVLSSLYPASTVILARVLLDERMSRMQLGGLGAALVGTVLIALG